MTSFLRRLGQVAKSGVVAQSQTPLGRVMSSGFAEQGRNIVSGFQRLSQGKAGRVVGSGMAVQGEALQRGKEARLAVRTERKAARAKDVKDLGWGTIALSSALNHPTLILAGLGGASSYVASGGDPGWGLYGAIAGGAVGLSRRGKYTFGKKGPQNAFYKRAVSSLGKKIVSNSPELSLKLGKAVPKFRGGREKIASAVGGRRMAMGAMAAGTTVALGVGAPVGVSLAKGIYNTFASEKRTTYGATFSGMGNGTAGRF